MRQIIAKRGELLDAICAREYPTIELSSALDKVTNANPQLSFDHLNNLEGQAINLPVIATEEPQPTITLWGQA